MRSERLVFVTDNSLRHGQPKAPVLAILGKRQSIVECQPWSSDPVKNPKRHTVKPHNTEPGRKPEVTVRGLENRFDGILRQALVGVPGVEFVLGRPLLSGQRTEKDGRRRPNREPDPRPSVG